MSGSDADGVRLRAFLPVRTNRLKIRPFGLGDRDALFELHRSPQVTRHAGGIKSRAESALALKRLVDRGTTTGFGALALEEIGSGEVIGWCGIQPIRELEGYEVIYALRHDKWGQALAYESAAALISVIFSNPSFGIDRIYGLVYPQNLRSIRVLEKLGMRFVRNYFDKGTQRPACIYAVDSTDFTLAQSSSK